MEQKRTGLSYVFTLAKEERGKLSLGMLLAVFSSALSFVPYLVVYQILLLIIKQEVTLPAMLGWAGIGIAAAVLQAILTSFAGICSHTAAFNTMHRIKVRVLEHMSKFNLGIVENKVLPDGSFAWKPYRDIADDLKPALESMEAGLYVDAEDLTNKLVRYFEEESLAGNDNIKGTADLPVILD